MLENLNRKMICHETSIWVFNNFLKKKKRTYLLFLLICFYDKVAWF